MLSRELTARNLIPFYKSVVSLREDCGLLGRKYTFVHLRMHDVNQYNREKTILLQNVNLCSTTCFFENEHIKPFEIFWLSFSFGNFSQNLFI